MIVHPSKLGSIRSAVHLKMRGKCSTNKSPGNNREFSVAWPKVGWNLIVGETRTSRTPAFWEYPSRPMITHTITMDSYQIPCHNKTNSKLQIPKICQTFKFCNNLYTQHTFWSCLIRCANMKWIRLVSLWKIQSGHDFVHRRTGGRQADGRTTWNQNTPFQLRWNVV